MKKIYLLLVAIMVTSLSFGQEMLTDGGLENWTDATTLADWSTYGGYTQETTDFHGGANAAKRDAASGTKKISQTITVVAGENYTASIWYKVISGDGTDARIWAKWKDSSDAYLTESPELVGPNNAFLPSSTDWTEYTVSLDAPVDAATLKFEVRSYAGSVVIFDDLSFIHNTTAQPGLSINTPSDGDIFPVGNDVVVNFDVNNFDFATEGHVHYTVGAVDATAADASDITLAGLTAGSYTLFMELVDTNDAPLSTAVNATVNFEVTTFTQVGTIAELRVGTVGNAYELTGEAFINFAQSYRNQKWIQDGSAGILVDDTDGNITAGSEGDGLTGIQGTLGEYKGMLQFIPLADAALVSPSTLTITPQVVTLADLTTNFEDYEAELVKVVNVMLDNSTNVTFVNGTVYPMTQGADAFNFRTNFYNTNLKDTDVPTVAVDIVGLPGEKTGGDSSDYGIVLAARVLADITEHTASISENNIKGFNMYPNPVNGDVLNITTLQNLDKNVQIFDILGKQILAKTVTGTTINVANLNAGIYLIKVEEAGNTVTRKLVIR